MYDYLASARVVLVTLVYAVDITQYLTAFLFCVS